jgi:hypothetical protein
MDTVATAISTGVPDTRVAAEFGVSGNSIATEALARPETGFKFGGLSQLPCLGVWCTVNRFHNLRPSRSPKRSVSDLMQWALRLSINR